MPPTIWRYWRREPKDGPRDSSWPRWASGRHLTGRLPALVRGVASARRGLPLRGGGRLLGPEVRDFLVETSILTRLTGSLCDAVTGRDDSAALLDKLERSNVFVIPLDDQRRSYRYHHLFAQLLRDRLRATSPDRQAALHRAAYQWFADAGDADPAIDHAVAAGDFEAAKDLVVDNVTERLAAGRLATILAWLDRFPDGYVRSSASLSIARAWACGMLGRRDRRPGDHRRTQRRLLRGPDARRCEEPRALGGLAPVRAAVRGRCES